MSQGTGAVAAHSVRYMFQVATGGVTKATKLLVIYTRQLLWLMKYVPFKSLEVCVLCIAKQLVLLYSTAPDEAQLGCMQLR